MNSRIAVPSAMAAAFALLLFALVLCCLSGQAVSSGSGLRDLARPNFYIGAAVSYDGFTTSAQYRSTLQSEYNIMMADNFGKMYELEPSRGSFSFSRQDALCSFAEAHRMKMEGGPLVWAQAVPTWVTNGRFSARQLQVIMTQYITTVVKHYESTCPGVIIAWEVVNEETTSGPGVWGTISDYVQIAFKAARAANSNVTLFYNDFHDEENATAVYNLVAPLKRQGLLDAVGFQSHFASVPDFGSIAASMQKFASVGLQVFVTEFDYRIPSSDRRTASNPTDLQMWVPEILSHWFRKF